MSHPPSAEASLEPRPRTVSLLSVLLLEDDPLDAELIQERLEREGLSVVLTRVDSDDAFTEALSADQHELILADYNIPGFHGLEALELTRRTRPQPGCGRSTCTPTRARTCGSRVAPVRSGRPR